MSNDKTAEKSTDKDRKDLPPDNDLLSSDPKVNLGKADPRVDPEIALNRGALGGGGAGAGNQGQQAKNAPKRYFRFVGHNGDGYVAFERAGERARLNENEATEVPGWLADKLQNNREFEEASEADAKADAAHREQVERSRPKAKTAK